MELPRADLPAIGKVVGVHLNYRGRAAQRGRVPAVPSYFLKPATSVASDGDPIVRPLGTELLAFEGEIALIVGCEARNITPEEGLDCLGWIAPANDVGCYDFRWADRGSNLLSKGQDGFTPLGPATPISSVDVDQLVLRTWLNGQVVQEDSTSNLLFSFSLLVADLARFLTLRPGDVILSGTPAGAALMEPGDVIKVEIEGLGSVTNPVVESRRPMPSFGAGPRVDRATRALALGTPEPRPVELSEAAKEKLNEVSTATLTVQLTRRGIRNAFIQGVRPTRSDRRLLGYAYTLRYVPLREDIRDADQGELNAQKRAVESIGPDEVLVMDARQDPGAGTIGDILAARAMMRGATGIVTDGGLRDYQAVAELDIPVYYQAAHAAVLGLVHYPLETNVPIACGGALVMPGDVLVGDADGVVVLPAALAEEIAHDAMEQEDRERWALERVRAGESVSGIYPLSAARRPDYEAWRAERGD
jgi:5-oxopent-3-ene-1,2,5-tricarboxylate decarboxylase / 2-hydroxyhepta-2,4-diene-1,7-dioate isomerase